MSVIDNLQWLFLSFGETLEPYIQEIVPRVIDNLSIKNDQVKWNSFNLLT